MSISIDKPISSRILFLFILTVVSAGMISIAVAEFEVIHDFAGGSVDGREPYGSLTPSGSTLYGMTLVGGSHLDGIIFKINTDGSGYTILHEFTSSSGDGSKPFGDLTLSGNTLYGMTKSGGLGDSGVIFKMNTDGNNYTNLHEFGAYLDGTTPYGSLTLSGSMLYGMTSGAGSNNYGTIFKINTNGSSYAILYNFPESSDDGQKPYGSLTLSGSTLYGMTIEGGSNNYGTIFKINTDGSGYSILHKFVGGWYDGQKPYGSLTLSGSMLYGMTRMAGDDNNGVIFEINTNGSNYRILHHFANYFPDGRNPEGSLILSGSSLAGMTYYGGSNNMGVIFRMTTDGINYEILHDFTGGIGGGQFPGYGALVEVDSHYYGMTIVGGSNNHGVVFKQLVPEPTVVVFLLLAAGLLLKIRKG